MNTIWIKKNKSILPSALLFTVHTAFGLPGNSDTAISETSRPCLNTLKVDLEPRPQAIYNCGVSSAAKIKNINKNEYIIEVIIYNKFNYINLYYKYS